MLLYSLEDTLLPMTTNRLLLLAIVTLSSSTVVAQTPNGNIAGHVFCNDSHTPCRFASVTIETAPPAANPASKPAPTHAYSTTTDLDGAFQINKVVPGDYYILGRLSGYLTPYDLARNDFHSDPALAAKAVDLALERVTVAPAQTSNVNLTLFRGSSLSGTVRYDDGGLAINISVKLYRKDDKGIWQSFANRSGDGPLASLFSAQITDDRGQFYEPALPPGIYTIEARLPEVATPAASILGPSELTVKLTGGDALRVFNGNKYRLNQAIPINIKEGEDRSGIEITLPTSGLHTVEGVVSTTSGTQGFNSGNVRLLDPETNDLVRETALTKDGSFEFKYVVTGTYMLEIEALTTSASDERSNRLPRLKTTLLVEHDLTGLAYTLAATQ